MENKPKFLSVSDETEISTDSEFFRLYLEGAVLALKEQDILDEPLCLRCLERLREEPL